jgi:WD40 repeat protein
MRNPLPIHRSILGFLLVCLALARSVNGGEPIPVATVDRKTPVDFETEILPILKQNCLACHSQTKPKGGLVLETPRFILKGGDTGPAIQIDKPAESLLVRAASHRVVDLEMPPSDNKAGAIPLKPDELGLIQLWIQQGATGEVHGPGPIAWQALPASFNTIYAVALTQDGQFAACGRGNRIFVYQIPAGQLAAQLRDPQLPDSAASGAAHRDTVNSLAFSRDGELLASGGYRELKIWRRVKPRQTLKSIQTADVVAAVASPDGHSIATVNSDGGIWLWPADGSLPALLAENRGTNTLLSFSPGANLLAAASGGFLEVMKLPDGALKAGTRAVSNITAVAWLNETNVMAGDSAGAIKLFGIDPNQPVLTPGKEFKAAGAIVALATAKALGNRVLASTEGGQVALWDIGNGKASFESKLGTAPRALAIRPDGKFVAAAAGSSASLFEVSNGKLFAEMKGDRRLNDGVSGAERDLAFAKSELDYRKTALKQFETNRAEIEARVKRASENNANLAKTLGEKQTALANALAAEKEAAKKLDDLRSGVRTAVEQYLQAAEDGQPATNQLAEAKTALEKFPETTKDKRKAAAEKLAEAKKQVAEAEKAVKPAAIAKSTSDHELELAKAASQKSTDSEPGVKKGLENAEAGVAKAETDLATAKRLVAAAEKPMAALAFSTDNTLVLTADSEGVLRTWSAESGAPCDTIGVEKGAKCAIFRGERTVLLGSGSGVAAWDLASNWRLASVIGTGGANSPIADRVNTLEFTPDGKGLISGGGEPSRAGEIKLWDVEDGHLLREFKDVHSDTVFSVDLSPDGKLLASAGADRFARVTDFVTGKVLRNLEGHNNHVLGVAWERDGRTLLTAGADNLAKTWDCETAARRKNIDGFSKEVTSVSRGGPAGQAVLTAGDGQVVVVNEDGGKGKAYNAGPDYLYSGAASADGRVIVAGGAEGVLRAWIGGDEKVAKKFAPPGT